MFRVDPEKYWARIFPMTESGCRATCFARDMANEPQENVEVSADEELSDEVLGVVSGGNGRPLAPAPTL